jgi:hypothetical protein
MVPIRKEGVMSFRKVATLGILWALSVIGAVTIATIARAQAQETIVLSGSDVGFRIEGQRGQTPVGKLVVRIDGQWVEAALSNVAAPRITVPLTEQPDIFPGLPGGRRP